MKKLLSKLPGLNSKSWLVRLLSYPAYGFLALIVIAIVVPSAPTLEVYATAPTKTQSVEIKGKTRSNVPVTLAQNDNVILETRATSSGDYSFQLDSLSEGEHAYTIESCDKKGSDHCTQQQATIAVDHTSPEPPVLDEILSSLTTSKLTITGEAEPQSEVNVTDGENEYTATTSELNKFVVEIPKLKEGKNELTATSLDKAGNRSERVTVITTLKTPESERLYKVVKVVDGDTIAIEGGITIRYIGIDTPETVDPRKPVQCYGIEASAKNKELVEGKEVRLEKDVSEYDKYKRTLRYVYVGDIFVNDYLVSYGFAKSSSYPPDIKHQEQFRQAEQEARENKRGMWSDSCATAIQPPAKTTTSTNGGSTSGSCSGSDRDCGDFATHAEAQAFFISCGGPASDSHKLDGDKDGSACESLP